MHSTLHCDLRYTLYTTPSSPSSNSIPDIDTLRRSVTLTLLFFPPTAFSDANIHGIWGCSYVKASLIAIPNSIRVIVLAYFRPVFLDLLLTSMMICISSLTIRSAEDHAISLLETGKPPITGLPLAVSKFGSKIFSLAPQQWPTEWGLFLSALHDEFQESSLHFWHLSLTLPFGLAPPCFNLLTILEKSNQDGPLQA